MDIQVCVEFGVVDPKLFSPELHKCYFLYIHKQIRSKVPILLYFVGPKHHSGNCYVSCFLTDKTALLSTFRFFILSTILLVKIENTKFDANLTVQAVYLITQKLQSSVKFLIFSYLFLYFFLHFSSNSLTQNYSQPQPYCLIHVTHFDEITKLQNSNNLFGFLAKTLDF